MMRHDDLEQQEIAAREPIAALKRLSNGVQAPPDFLAQVLARAEQLPSPRPGRLAWVRRWLAGGRLPHREVPARYSPSERLIQWVTSLWPLTPAPALAALLLLSLALNAWLGVRVLGPGGQPPDLRDQYRSERGDRQVVQALLDTLAPQDRGAGLFNTYRFQAGIRSETELGRLAAAHPALQEPVPVFGFAGPSELATWYVIGAHYAEASAYLRSGYLEEAAKRLDAIRKALSAFQIPSLLDDYLSNMLRLLVSKQYVGEVLGEALALFQPLCEDYARGRGAEQLALFRIGTWLVDMRLAAAAGDKASLTQADTVQYVLDGMKRMDVPQGVLDALVRIGYIVAQPKMTDEDVQGVLALVKRLQTTLQQTP